MSSRLHVRLLILVSGMLGASAGTAATTPRWVEEIRPATAADVDLIQAQLTAPADGDRDAVTWVRDLTRARSLVRTDPGVAADLLTELVSQHPEVLPARTSLAWAFYRAEKWPEAATAFAECAALGADRISQCHFNRACALARGGEREAALDALGDALATGWEERQGFLADDDLASLREDPRFLELAGSPQVADLDRVAGWRHDLAYLGEELTRMHWRLTHGDDRGDPLGALDKLAAQVAELDDEQIAGGLQKIMAGLGDGHTVLYPMPGRVTPTRFLPLVPYWFADGLFVVAASVPDYEQWVGAEVVAVGGVPAAKLFERMAPYVSRDNPMGLLWIGPVFLRFTSVLRDAGMLEADGTAVLELRLPGESPTTVRVTPNAQMGGQPGALPVPAGVPAPLWQQHPGEAHWIEWMPEAAVLYVHCAMIRDDGDRTIAGLAAQIGEQVADRSPRAVILDLRRNSGGNGFLNRPLVAALMAYEAADPAAQLYVLSGRSTFSAAQNLLADIDYWTEAKTAGEPSGSRPNFIGESSKVRMPWSGLIASVASRYHQSSYPTDQRLWIGPDVPVRLTSGDYFAGRDPVLEAVLDLVGQAAAETGAR